MKPWQDASLVVPSATKWGYAAQKGLSVKQSNHGICPQCETEGSIFVDDWGLHCPNCGGSPWLALLGFQAQAIYYAAREFVHCEHVAEVLTAAHPSMPRRHWAEVYGIILKEVHSKSLAREARAVREAEKNDAETPPTPITNRVQQALDITLKIYRAAGNLWASTETGELRRVTRATTKTVPYCSDGIRADQWLDTANLHGHRVLHEAGPKRLVHPHKQKTFALERVVGKTQRQTSLPEPSREELEAACSFVRERYPGIDLQALKILILLQLVAQLGWGTVVMAIMTGVSGSGKQAIVKLATVALGGSCVSVRLDSAKWHRNVGLAAREGATILLLDEIGRERHIGEKIGLILELGPKVRFDAKYANETDIALRAALVITSSTLQDAILNSPEMGRRSIAIELSGCVREWERNGLIEDIPSLQSRLYRALRTIAAHVQWVCFDEGPFADWRGTCVKHFNARTLSEVAQAGAGSVKNECLRKLYQAYRQVDSSLLRTVGTLKGWLSVDASSIGAAPNQNLVRKTVSEMVNLEGEPRAIREQLSEYERLDLQEVLGISTPHFGIRFSVSGGHFGTDVHYRFIVTGGCLRGQGPSRESWPDLGQQATGESTAPVINERAPVQFIVGSDVPNGTAMLLVHRHQKMGVRDEGTVALLSVVRHDQCYVLSPDEFQQFGAQVFENLNHLLVDGDISDVHEVLGPIRESLSPTSIVSLRELRLAVGCRAETPVYPPELLQSLALYNEETGDFYRPPHYIRKAFAEQAVARCGQIFGEIKFPPQDQLVGELDVHRAAAEINARGIGFNVELASRLLAMNSTAIFRQTEQLGLPGWALQSEAALREFLRRCGDPSLGDLCDLAVQTLTVQGRNALNAYLDSPTVALTGLSRCLQSVHADGRLRSAFVAFSSTGGRFSTPGTALHSFSKNRVGLELDDVRQLQTGTGQPLERLAKKYSTTPSAIVKSAMRACVVPREAHYLIDADFVSIEPAVLAWVVEDKEWMTCFEQGYDVHAALKQAITTKVPELPVELARGQAKELGLKVLYGMGDTKLSVGLEAMGLGAVTPKVLREAVSEAYPEYLGFTSDLSDAAWQAVTERKSLRLGCLGLVGTKSSLRIQLPSGRTIGLHDVTAREWTLAAPGMLLVGADEYYPAKLLNLVVQAVARDVLGAGLVRLAKGGYEVVAHVHDQVLVEHVNPEVGTALARLLEEPPDWAPDMPLRVTHVLRDTWATVIDGDGVSSNGGDA